MIGKALTAVIATLALAGLSLPAYAQRDSGVARSRSSAVSQEKPSKYDFELPYVGKQGKLSFKELAESDKPFVVFIWLTDCELCHLQLPYVEQLQKVSDENSLGVRVVSICLDGEEETALEYMEDKGLSFDVLLDPRGRHVDTEYHVKDLGTPLAYVFKPGGEYVDYLSGYRSGFTKAVLKLLGIQPPAKAKL